MIAVYLEKVDVLHCCGAGCPGASVENGDLTKEFAAFHNVECDLIPRGRCRVDPNPTRQNAVEAVAGVAFAENIAMRLKPHHGGKPDELIERLLWHCRNQKVLRKQLASHRGRIGDDHSRITSV